jgi:hypothetical protein
MSNLSWWPQDDKTKDLMLGFFLNFSRLEFALKLVPDFNKTQGHFQADWDAFKTALSKNNSPPALEESLQYLRNAPPKKQVGPDKWQEIDYRCDWTLLITSLKTVRNNFFHGGKQPFDPDRDQKLIEHCNKVILEMVELSPPEIQKAFKEGSA